MKKQKSIISIFIAIFFAIINAQVGPTVGLHEHPPRIWALTNGRIHIEPGKVIEIGTIVIRNGLIDTVGSSIEIPRDATLIDLDSATVYPGFIESWLVVPELTTNNDTLPSYRAHWNEKVRPDRIALNNYHLQDPELEVLHSLGFTTAHIIPEKGIFKGQSSIIQLAKIPVPLSSSVAQVLGFEFGGWSSVQYPNSLLGCVALIRQTFLDAEWYDDAQQIIKKYPYENEPIKDNPSLSILASSTKNKIPFIFDAKDELYVLRAGSIAEEFKLNFWIKGSGYEYRRVKDIRQLNPFLIIPVDYPAKPEVSNPYQALAYSTEQLKHWDLAPDNIQRLVAEGLEIALTTTDLKDRKQFRTNLVRSIQRGLTEISALASLTTIPAEKMGVGNRVGKIAPGYMANLTIVEGNYFDGKSKVLSVWISGDEYRVMPPFKKDFSGDWELIWRRDTLLLSVSQKANNYFGKISRGTISINLTDIEVDGDRLSWTSRTDSIGIAGITRFIGHLGKDIASGKAVQSDGTTFRWQATLKTKDISEEIEPESESPSGLNAWYPEGAFGFETLPERKQSILVKNATIWTCGPRGILKDYDILFTDGKIAKIDRDIFITKGRVLVIDGKGKHVTPGLIDCHSHSAASSINEGTQSVTAEVRIRDVLNSDDIAIYRELAGGLTVANILHGSANAIGGQNAVIKLRWGNPPEDLIFRQAPQGIKFALGENVKQSNWGEKYNTRYPQTRMGVEQIIRDAFTTAGDYEQQWKNYRSDAIQTRNKVPPRRDLELEALVEVMNGDRLVHCHSYRQDEILMLTRVAEDFGFTIGVFQHVLEGYKVADRIAEHGAGASAFSDWWAYKMEVYDAIPYNGALMHDVGVNVSFNSDSGELARHLNTEAAKAVKYGGLSEEEALKLVTINPARQLGVDQWVGSLELGKDADFVIWSDHPLSTYAICEQTWIDGKSYFSIKQDTEMRKRDAQIRNQVVQKILSTKDADGRMMEPEAESQKSNRSCVRQEEL